jgi:predicted PurR-regulated permease PerM
MNNDQSSATPASSLLTVVGAVAALYFARVLLIPLALAVLLAFLLAPIVHWLRRRGLWRIPSVLLVVLLAFALVGAIGAVMGLQLSDLAHKLPDYEQNVHRKIESLRASGSGVITRATRWAQETTEELTPKPANQPPTHSSPQGEPPQTAPIPVEIHSNFSLMAIIQRVLGSVLNILTTAIIVVVFVIFLLIEEDSLRDRLIRLADRGQGILTTRVLGDAAWRVSRYLLAQTGVNVAYGLLMGVVLSLMRVPNPVLWGTLAALCRYIPYLGIWIAGAMPAMVAFAVEPGWMKMPVILGLYFGIDLLLCNLVEPFLYGNSTGVSPLAILVAAVFWTWLWGPVGLLLSTPLTVLVLAVSREAPQFEFLSVLLGDDTLSRPGRRLGGAGRRWNLKEHHEGRRQKM